MLHRVLLNLFALYSSFAYMMSRYSNVYTPGSSTTFYPAMLKLLKGINSGLRKEGILAPGLNSIENTKRLYDMIGQPLDNIPTIHVGGTNGKGTTSFKLSECLRRSGFKTGLFVSPHIASYRERVQVNTELISEESVCSNLSRLLDLCATHEIPATEFELSFLLASLHFKETNCEAVVLEVGCGGLYDATNVVSTATSVICSVSLDHTRILGATIPLIARNKAGIFKSGRPALVGPDVPLAEVQEVSQQRGAVLYSFKDAVKRYRDKGWIDRLKYPANNNDDSGSNDDSIIDTDDLNADLTLLTLCLLKEHHPDPFASLDLRGAAVAEGLACRPPCRWETLHHDVIMADGSKRRVKVVLDLGHNPAAVSALSRRIVRDFSGSGSNCGGAAGAASVRVVYAMSRDKDVLSCLSTLMTAIPRRECIHFVQSDNFRAISKEELSHLFKQVTGQEMAHLRGNTIRETLQEVFQLAANDVTTDEKGNTQRESVVVVCGTSYIMPETKAFLGIVEPRDSEDLKRQES